MTPFSSQQVHCATHPHGALYILHQGIPGIARPMDASLVARMTGWSEAASVQRLREPHDTFAGLACLHAPRDIFAGLARHHTLHDFCAGSPSLCAPVPLVAESIVLCGTATSSLDLAWNLMGRDAFPVWSMAVAAIQEQGRGQLRREWISPEGNIYAALRLPQTGVFSEMSASVLVGALLARALEQMGAPVKVKWPNDLVARDTGGCWKKVGGILLEERHGALLAGIGLNILSSPPDSRLRPDHACKACSFLDLGQEKAFLPLATGMIQLVGCIRFCYAHFLHQRQRHELLHFAEKELAFKDGPVFVCDGESRCGPFWIQGLETSREEAGGLRLCDARGKERLLLSGSIFPEKNV